MIPFGAKVNFKPSDARKHEAPSKFSPRSIPGIFAGYEIDTGMKWSRKMRVWSMSVMSTIIPSFDLEKVPLRLIDPHLTEVAILVEPIEFPMKIEYERVNGTIGGLKNRDDPEIEDQDEDEDDDKGDDDDGKGDKPKELKELDAEVPKLLHYSEGVASDGIIYINDFGEEVKLDSKGRAYKVGSDGRKLMPSKRPARYITPEEWKKMSLKEREASTKAADDIAREEVEEEDRITKKKSKKDKKEKKEKKDKRKKESREEAIKEMEDMFDALAESEAEARSSGSKDKAAPSPYLSDDDISTDGDTSPHDSDAYPDEWLEWEEFVSQQEGPRVDNSKSDEHTYEALVCITENVSTATPSTKVKKEMVTAPLNAMYPIKRREGAQG